MSQIRITVGALRDRSVDDVFDGLVSKAKRARAQVAAETKASASAEKAAWRDVEKELARMERERTADVKKQAKDRLKAEKESAALVASETKRAARDRANAEREALRSIEQERSKAEREETQRQRRLRKEIEDTAKAHSKAAIAVARAAISGGGRALRFGAGVLGDLARATGVRTDISSMFAANADLETRAVNLSNSGYMAGDKRNGARRSTKELQDFAFEKGSATGFAANDVLASVSAFVAKTGDLSTGMDSFEKMAQLARATGSDITDMADAMGDVSNTLGDIPDKANVLNSVMRQVAGQGKLGAVEIRDLATQMAKVAAAAGQLEGDAAKNIGLMGAFAQESRQRGGSATATQAATSVSAMLANFKQPTAVNEFKARGISVYNTNGQIRDPKAILLEALKSAGNDPVAMKAMYRTAQADRAVSGFASIYRDAYASSRGSRDDKTAAGLAAVEAEFDRLQKAAMQDAEVMESFQKSMGTGEAQATVFNNEMQKATNEMQSALTPALITFAPAVVSATKNLSDFAVRLLGEDAAKVEGDADKARSAVDTDLANTNKQFATGTVFQEQLDKNKADAKVLRERIQSERDAADHARGNTTGLSGEWNKEVAGLGAVSDQVWNGEGIGGKLGWGSFGGLASTYVRGGKAYVKAQKDNAAGLDASASNDQAHLDQLNATMKSIQSALENKTLKVQVVGGLKGHGGPRAPAPLVSQMSDE